MDNLDKLQKILPILGILPEAALPEGDAYLEAVRKFLMGQDFMRMGHCIQGKRWHLVMSNSARLKERCTELGITCFDNYLKAIREAARHQDAGGALQIMSQITAKRVLLRNMLVEEVEACDM